MVSLGLTCHLSWMNEKIAQCWVPGSVTRRSRDTLEGTSSRKLARAFAYPFCDAESDGDAVWAALNWYRPRDPPRSCTWSRKSRLWRTSRPVLKVWLPRILVKVEAMLYVFSERSQGR